MKELDLSRLTLRLVSEVDKKGENKGEGIKAKITGSTLDTLRRCLYTPTQIAMRDPQGRESKVTVSMRFLPVQMQLDPSESFNNSGNLRVDVLDAKALPSADRNGFSDPYCKFFLNGKDVYKTKTQKKTLSPVWNEMFEAVIQSRTAAKFEVHVFDWDFGDKADFLGKTAIDLNKLEPMQSQEVVLPLDGKSGSIRLRMLFKPDFIVRSRQGSSTFQGTFAAPVGTVVGAPIKGVGKGAAFVGGGVKSGAGFLRGGFKRRTVSQQGGMPLDDGDANGVPDGEPVVADAPSSVDDAYIANGQPSMDSARDAPATPVHQRQTSMGRGSQPPPPGAEYGTANITILAATGYGGTPKLEVHVLQDGPKGPKDLFKTDHRKPNSDGEVRYENESKRIPCMADTKFILLVKDHKTFGSDQLGEGVFYINDQSGGGQQEVKVGSGTVVLRSSFQPADTASLAPPGSSSDSPSGRKGGVSRFMSRRERSVTPSG